MEAHRSGDFSEDQKMAILDANKDKEFVRRILDPKLNPKSIKNPDGSMSTHSMAAEVDEEGNWFVFPTVVNEGGTFRRIEDAQEARKYNQERGEVIPFGKNKDGAIKFSKQYKPQAFKNYVRDVNDQSNFSDLLR